MFWVIVLTIRQILEKTRPKYYYRHAHKLYGAEINHSNGPIGGGDGYHNVVEKYTTLVGKKNELLNALKSSKIRTGFKNYYIC
jgi:hypothetical protein